VSGGEEGIWGPFPSKKNPGKEKITIPAEMSEEERVQCHRREGKEALTQ